MSSRSRVRAPYGVYVRFPSLVKGERLKIACVCFVGSNPTLTFLRPLIVKKLLYYSVGRAPDFNLVVQGSSP